VNTPVVFSIEVHTKTPLCLIFRYYISKFFDLFDLNKKRFDRGNCNNGDFVSCLSAPALGWSADHFWADILVTTFISWCPSYSSFANSLEREIPGLYAPYLTSPSQTRLVYSLFKVLPARPQRLTHGPIENLVISAHPPAEQST
jgi:hypothetical protein